MANKCGYCGATVIEGIIFCIKCGQRTTSANLLAHKKCPRCGQWFGTGRNSCVYCGYSSEEHYEETGDRRLLIDKPDSFEPVYAPDENLELAQNQETIKESESLPWSNPYSAEGIYNGRCLACGEPVERDFRFCRMCGAPVLKGESLQNSSEPEIHRINSEAENQQDAIPWNRKDGLVDDYPKSSFSRSFWEGTEQTVVRTLQNEEEGALYPTGLFQSVESGNSEKKGDLSYNNTASQETISMIEDIFDVPVDSSSVFEAGYKGPFEDSSIPETGSNRLFGVSPVPGDIYVTPEPVLSNKPYLESELMKSFNIPSLDTSSPGKIPLPSVYSSDFQNKNGDIERDKYTELPDSAQVKGESADAVPKEDDSGGNLLYISSDLLKAMENEKKEDIIPKGFSAPTKL